MKEFNIKTNVCFGANALARLEQIQNKRVIIICDDFMMKSGVTDKVKSHLTSCEVFVFSKVVPDPPIEIVSEGIETKEHFDTACELGIDYIQGYYFSKPLPKEQFITFIKEQQA